MAHYQSAIAGESSTSGGTSSTARPSRYNGSWIRSAHRWFTKTIGSTKGESAPLINPNKGVLELPRLTTRKILVSVSSIVLAIFALGALLVYMLFHRQQQGRKQNHHVHYVTLLTMLNS